MGLSTFLNSKALNSYFYELIQKYDKDGNGFTKSELSDAFLGMSTIFAKGIIKISSIDKKIFKTIDTNDDKILSYSEIDTYIKKEYNLDLEKIKNMKLSDICKEIEKQNDSD